MSWDRITRTGFVRNRVCAIPFSFLLDAGGRRGSWPERYLFAGDGLPLIVAHQWQSLAPSRWLFDGLATCPGACPPDTSAGDFGCGLPAQFGGEPDRISIVPPSDCIAFGASGAVAEDKLHEMLCQGTRAIVRHHPTPVIPTIDAFAEPQVELRMSNAMRSSIRRPIRS